jgi:glycerol-3-phosphate dehydrogenase
MSVALKLNDLIGFDRNWYLAADKKLSAGRILSKNECLEYCPDLSQQDLTGGALFFDGQVRNSERLILCLLISASRSGAVLANYVRATQFQKSNKAIVGMCVEDLLTGRSVDIKARVFVNCSGPWTNGIIDMAGIIKRRAPKRWVKAALILTRQLIPTVAVGVRGNFSYHNPDACLDKNYRYLFITPWEYGSLVGTFEAPYNGSPDDFSVTEDEIRSFVELINAAYPAGHLTRNDVRFVYGGLVPAADRIDSFTDQPAKQYELRDHGFEDGVEGLISVIGVKFTTARHVAEMTVNLIETKLGRRPKESRTADKPVYGGEINCFEEFLENELEKRPCGLSKDTIRHLLETYGSEYREVLQYCERDQKWSKPITSNSPVIRAEILHAIREEMACTLEDLLYRRTHLGVGGDPDQSCINACANIMAGEFGSRAENKQGRDNSGLKAI